MKQPDHAEFEHFASTHLASVLHVATLLTGNKALAAELSLEAMRRIYGRSTASDDQARLRQVYAAVLRGWRRRRRTPLEQAQGPLELQDLRPESATATVTAPSTDNIIRDGLRALTDGERSVLVLHVVAGLEVDDISRVVRRPGRLVRRDLATSLAFLADASSTGSSRIEAQTEQALKMRPRGQTEAAELLTKLQTALAADSTRPRRSRASLVVGAAAATAVVVVAAFLVGRSGDSGDVATDDPATSPQTDATSLELPRTPSGLKLVGFQRIMLTVPESWEQSTPLCINVYNDSVLYPMDNELPPCIEATVPGSSVGFGRYNTIEGHVAFKRDHRILAGEPLFVSQVIKGNGEFLQYAALKNANVAVSVRSTERADLTMILSSVQEVPATYVVVPNCLKLDPDKASDLLGDNALNGQIFADSSNAGSPLPVSVVTQSPPVGTLLPFDATVNLGVLPN
jgi:DNA-directed RNA polymerase specialized sigma24 family protein